MAEVLAPWRESENHGWNFGTADGEVLETWVETESQGWRNSRPWVLAQKRACRNLKNMHGGLLEPWMGGMCFIRPRLLAEDIQIKYSGPTDNGGQMDRLPSDDHPPDGHYMILIWFHMFLFSFI